MCEIIITVANGLTLISQDSLSLYIPVCILTNDTLKILTEAIFTVSSHF